MMPEARCHKSMAHPTRKFFVQLFLLFFPVAFATAQISYTGGTYTQNFDTLPSSGTVTLTTPTSAPGLIYSFTTDVGASGMPGWSFIRHFPATASGTSRFLISDGNSSTGAAFSFGTTASTERALGALGSGSNATRFGAVFTNNTGTTITEFTLAYTGEQWRRGTATADRLIFSYAIGAATIAVTASTQTSDGIPVGFTAVGGLNFLSPLSGSGPTNGNVVKQSISATVPGISWAPGQTLVLQWTDRDDGGSDDGLAIDDLKFTTNAGAGPVAPAVTSANPASGAINVSPATSIAITFNAPVTVSGTWFTITGSVSGSHPATVMGGPTTYTLVPAPTFAEGETVTVNVLAAQVADAVTGTAHPTGDYSFSFTTQTYSPLPIHTIQGGGNTSAYVGQVVAVEGIVTATFQGPGGLGGFYVQAADYDADPATSEGIFVFNNSFTVSPGQMVKVAGTVAEFGPLPSTQTELTSVTLVTVLGTGVPLPTPVEVSLPFASITYAERYEGMRVTLPQTLTVTDNFDLGHFGEIFLSNGRLSTPTNIVAPGAPAIAQDVANFLSRILLDDGVGTTYPDPTPFLADSAGRGLTRRAGSTVTGVTGILDEKFGSYIIEPTASLTFVDANPRSDPPVVGGTLKVAIGNVLNFFNGNGSGLVGSAGGFPTSRGADTLVEFQRQRAKIIAAITALAPDIMGLTEVENDRVTNGLTDSYGTTSAIADLVNGLNAAALPGTTYAFVDAAAVDIVTDEIHCGFIYRTETVAPVGLPAMLNSPYYNNLARNPLAQTFRELASGEKLTVSINHFKSKGSASTGAAATDGLVPNPNLDQLDGQGQSNYLRTRQAEALVAWLATDPTGSGDPDFLIIGDLNSYAKEDPIVVIENDGYINLTEAAEGVGGYSYAFDGEFGHLDHALANDHLAEQVTDAVTWHVNADEPVYYDYNVENKNAAQQAINTGGAYRYSDHDPVVVGLTLHPEYTAPFFTLQPEAQTVLLGDPVTFTAAVSGYPLPTLQWQKDGADLPGATGGSLTISATTMGDAGSYAAVATNSQGITTSSAVTLIVRDVTPPVLNLPASQTLEATGPGGAPATFTASALDNVDGVVPVSFSQAPGSIFALGTTTVTVTATDAAGNVTTGSFTITVADTTAPVIANLTASPNSLWPANHKLVTVTLTAAATDAASAPVTFHIVSAVSNEPDNGLGDGDTSGDIIITGPMTLSLRAERAGNGPGRIYTITIRATDDAGNTSTQTVAVSVPRNK